MPRFSYDLHLHTCLSPCGDDEMTPPNLANMAFVKGLDLIAVTDHNSCRNAGAVMAAARELPLTVLPGIEVNTSEEVHAVCIFPDLASATAAGEWVEAHLLPVDNRPGIFGNQLIMDQWEQVLGTVSRLLINATTLSLDDLPAFVQGYGGLWFPAHIDRPSNSVLSNLGFLPDYLDFSAVEVARPEAFFAGGQYSTLSSRYHILTDSDAHRLPDISEPLHFLELPSPTFASLHALLSAPPSP